MFNSLRCGRVIGFLILINVLVCDRSCAISFAKGASRSRPTETSSAAQLYYRNGLHPEDEIVTSMSSVSNAVALATYETPISKTPNKVATTGSRSPISATSVDKKTVVSILYTQLCVMLLSTVGFGVLSLHVSNNGLLIMDHLLWTSVVNALAVKHWNPEELVYGIAGAIPLIFVHHYNLKTTSQFGTDQKIQHDHFATSTDLHGDQMEMTHMTLKLFGRRRHVCSIDQPRNLMDDISQNALQSPSHTSEVPTTPAATFIFLSALITGMIAVSNEMTYRLYLPLLIGYFTNNALALFIPAIMYGFSHIQWNQLSPRAVPKFQWMILHKTAASVWYTYLLTSSGSLFLPIIAHFLYDMDTLTTTWHRINDQMDQVDQTLQRSEVETTQSTVVSKLSAEAAGVSRRIFHAFDSQHLGSLNESDVHRLVQYMYYNKQQMQPSSEMISREFHRFAQLEKDAAIISHARLEFDAFVKFLNQLHRYEKLQTV